jgi:ribosomal protein S12
MVFRVLMKTNIMNVTSQATALNRTGTFHPRSRKGRKEAKPARSLVCDEAGTDSTKTPLRALRKICFVPLRRRRVETG